MEHQDKKLEIWKEAIPRMNEEDLEFILDFPECFEPKVLKMVRTRYDKITKPEDDEEEFVEVKNMRINLDISKIISKFAA